LLGSSEYKIDAELLERARVMGRGWWEIPSEGNPELCREIQRRAASERCTERELLWCDAMASDVSSPVNGSLYWGYKTPMDPTVESHYVALAWAERHNARHPDRPVVTFWTTAGAARLSAVNRLNHAERDLLRFDSNYLVRVWESMCLRFAEGSSGEILVFGTYFHPHVILGRTELPALRRNPLVRPDRIHFVHPPPERLSDGRLLTENLRDVLAEPGNRACIQFDAPDCPGFLDVEVTARLPYRLLVEEVAALRAEVEAADRAWNPLPITPDCPAGIVWHPPIVERRVATEGAVKQLFGIRPARSGAASL
jgi:hypothetical protein